MILRVRWILLVSLATSLSCGGTDPSACPTKLNGLVGRTNLTSHGDASGIQWGGDSVVVSAEIAAVKVECYSVVDEAEKNPPRSYTYTVAVTAYLTRTIVDSVRFEARSRTLFGGYDDAVKFQLVSADGVVLEESEEATKLNSVDSEFALSTKFEGLSLEQVRRARTVQAFWTYGH